MAFVNLRCHAQRQLNPFAGVLQVAETDLARAFSVNGVLWQVQVIAERPDHTWRSSGEMRIVRQFFNWGLWSAQDGMQQVSANPILDIGAMASAADQLTSALNQRLAELPFALSDRYELWCCDYRGQPVALLGSACERQDAHASRGRWLASAADDDGFISSHLLEAGQPTQSAHSSRAHAERLESLVRQRAQARHWFRREDDGSGTRLDSGERLAADAFPALGLSEDWPEHEKPLVEDYLDWLAPLLLMLPTLDQARRAQLEQAALQRATLVADLYRLYPQVIEPALIEQARVEARLRRSA